MNQNQYHSDTIIIAEFRNATFRCFEVEGDSMEDTIYHKDWVIGKFVESIKRIKEGNIYVVVTDEGVVVKRIFNQITQNQSLLLVSDNDFYSPYNVPLGEIKEIWYVVKKMSSYLPSKRSELKRQVSELQSNFMALKQQIN